MNTFLTQENRNFLVLIYISQIVISMDYLQRLALLPLRLKNAHLPQVIMQ